MTEKKKGNVRVLAPCADCKQSARDARGNLCVECAHKEAKRIKREEVRSTLMQARMSANPAELKGQQQCS